jgi:hypothetical protein
MTVVERDQHGELERLAQVERAGVARINSV